MLGEYAQDMSDAPYILENLIENWEEEHSAEVRLHLLTAAMKCFFKRAPETQKALGIALAAGIADFHQVSSDLSLPNFSCFETIGPLDHLFNINCWSRMFTIEPCSTIVFCNTTYMWLNVWLVLQNRRFQYLLTLKAVKSKTVYLTSLTAFLWSTRRYISWIYCQTHCYSMYSLALYYSEVFFSYFIVTIKILAAVLHVHG